MRNAKKSWRAVLVSLTLPALVLAWWTAAWWTPEVPAQTHHQGASCEWMAASAALATPASESFSNVSRDAAAPEWEILGHYAEACNCEVGCPCIYKSPASHGNCQVTLAFSITKGRYGPLDLSGLQVVVVGEMIKGEFSAYYVDEKATLQQQEALTGIFRGIFGTLFKNDMGVKAVPILMDAGSPDSVKQNRGVTIPGILQLEVEKVTGLDNQGPTRVRNPTAHFISELLVAKSKTYRFKDHGQSWEYSGRSGFHGEFFFSSLFFK